MKNDAVDVDVDIVFLRNPCRINQREHPFAGRQAGVLESGSR